MNQMLCFVNIFESTASSLYTDWNVDWPSLWTVCGCQVDLWMALRNSATYRDSCFYTLKNKILLWPRPVQQEIVISLQDFYCMINCCFYNLFELFIFAQQRSGTIKMRGIENENLINGHAVQKSKMNLSIILTLCLLSHFKGML